MKHPSRMHVMTLLVLAGLLLSLAGCQGAIVGLAMPAAAVQAATSTPQAAPTTATTTSTTTTATVSTDPTDFASAVRNVAQALSPTVVQITNEQTTLDVFNTAYTLPAGVGSGFIYDDKGHIMTNNHVVEGAEKLLVSLTDGRSFPAKLIGGDPDTDIAVVQIDAPNLVAAQIGDPHTLHVGDWVVAIGNALALPGGPTVSTGVIGALGRTVQEPGSATSSGAFLFDVIQTGSPINPGNSGGPLVDLSGRVVGINTLVAGTTSGGVQAEGIGFAIAIDTAKPIADTLVKDGKVIHPSLGFVYVPLNPFIVAQLGLAGDTTGVAIASIGSSGNAAKAGLQRFDVITAVDGTKLVGDSDLAAIVNSHKPGDTLNLAVQRDGKATTIALTLGTES